MVMLPPTKVSAYPKLFSSVFFNNGNASSNQNPCLLYPKLFSNASLITTSRFSFRLYFEDKKDFILIMQLFVALKGRGIITFCLIIKH